MDLNDLFCRHQLALAGSDDAAPDPRARQARISDLADRIAVWQRAAGAGFADVGVRR